jgi:hypothetical protein
MFMITYRSGIVAKISEEQLPALDALLCHWY